MSNRQFKTVPSCLGGMVGERLAKVVIIVDIVGRSLLNIGGKYTVLGLV